MNNDYIDLFDKENFNKKFNALKPYIDEKKFKIYNSNKRNISFLRRKLFNENLIIIDSANIYHISADPVLLFQVGSDINSKKNFYTNTRGFLIKGFISSKISIYSEFYENQALFPEYISKFIDSSGVSPGDARVKQFKDSLYDFAFANGLVNLNISNNFNILLGHSKNFVGNGYRSVLLSDITPNYPYFRFSYKNEKYKLKYSIIYALLQDLKRIPFKNTAEALFFRKAATFYLLEYMPFNFFEITLFNSIIWEIMDNSGSKKFNMNIFNPIIIGNSLINDWDNKTNNSMAGINLNINLPFNLSIYGQFAYDAQNKYAYQGGIKFLANNIIAQVEYNYSSPNIYNSEKNIIDYYHYNQNLALFYGDNYSEFISRLKYSYKRININFKYNKIFNTGYLEKKNIDFFTGEIAFLINPATNFKFFTNFTTRTTLKPLYNKSNFFYIGIKTDIRNTYYDF